MKKIFGVSLFSFMMIFLVSCEKDKGYDNNEYGLGATSINDKPIIQILEGGLQQFSKSTLKFDATADADTAYFSLYYINKGMPADKDITVTIGYSASALATYNANNPTSVFEVLPDSTFSLPVTSITIKKGQTFSDPIAFIFYPTKINSSKLYLFPISILSVSDGSIISANNGTRYINIIGNPLAGAYTTTGSRTNYTGSVAWTGPPAPLPSGGVDGTTAAYSGTVVADAVDGQTIQLVMGNVPDPAGGSAFYLITANATFTSITYDFAATFTSGYSNIQKYVVSFTPASGTQKASFHLITKYNNNATGTGNDRIIDQTFTHQ